MSKCDLEDFCRAQPLDKTEILAYLKPDLGNCLYLFLDIDTYEIGAGVIDVWIQRAIDSTIIGIAMRYMDSFQLYARQENIDKVNYADLANLIKCAEAMRVSAPKGIIRALKSMLEESFDDSYGVVMELVSYKSLSNLNVHVEEASRGDIPEIVNIIVNDEDLGASYELQEMVKQFEERYDQGMGKSFVIRKDGSIIAHLGFSAITSEFVIAAYTVVKPENRNYPYGAFLDSYLINLLLPRLSKRGFAFMQDSRRIKLFELMGNPIVGEYGKLLRKEK